MASTWCRSAAKLRAVTCLHKTQGNLFVSCGNFKQSKFLSGEARGVTQYVQQTTLKRPKVKYLTELYRRRMEAGPEQERHPSKLGCWNIEAERYAFGQRLGEEFDEKWLRLAFRCSSLRAEEYEKQEELGINIDTVVADNMELAQQGRGFASKYISAYLRYSFPDFLEEGIRSVCDHLLSDETLLFLATNFGLTDLIDSSIYPPTDLEYITTFLAVIGALLRSKGEERAKFFVLDFIVPQLNGKDISEIWRVNNPVGVVAGILESLGRGPPEARILSTSARNTIMAVYNVGIYSDKKQIGKSPGETPSIAEELAARDALKNLMNLDDSRPPLLLGDCVRSIQLDIDRVNKSVKDVLKLGTRRTQAVE